MERTILAINVGTEGQSYGGVSTGQTGISDRLEKIIKNAEERLWLISPYLKVNNRLKELLEGKKPSVDVRVIYGKSELQPEEKKWLEGLTQIKTSFRPNLHAKCYLNENEALLTSMNLYEFSEKNNDEMGVLVSTMTKTFTERFSKNQRGLWTIADRYE